MSNDTTTCGHTGTLGQSPTGAVCNECGADWDQICRDRPELLPPHKRPDGGQGTRETDLEYLRRRIREINYVR